MPSHQMHRVSKPNLAAAPVSLLYSALAYTFTTHRLRLEVLFRSTTLSNDVRCDEKL